MAEKPYRSTKQHLRSRNGRRPLPHHRPPRTRQRRTPRLLPQHQKRSHRHGTRQQRHPQRLTRPPPRSLQRRPPRQRKRHHGRPQPPIRQPRTQPRRQRGNHQTYPSWQYPRHQPPRSPHHRQQPTLQLLRQRPHPQITPTTKKGTEPPAQTHPPPVNDLHPQIPALPMLPSAK